MGASSPPCARASVKLHNTAFCRLYLVKYTYETQKEQFLVGHQSKYFLFPLLIVFNGKNTPVKSTGKYSLSIITE